MKSFRITPSSAVIQSERGIQTCFSLTIQSILNAGQPSPTRQRRSLRP
nr:MAG TPA: hypothetical protein [Caudoviricetes sp.]